jgi:hypothetical protein
MKTLLLPLATVLVIAMLMLGSAAATPDFAIQSEVWELDGNTWDVRVCAHIVYFVGPWAVEDREDCNLPWVLSIR